MSVPVDLSTRRFLKAMAAGAAVLAAGCASPDPSKVPDEGFEYRAAERPWPTESGSRLEVVEFFWFGCPHCNAMEPVLKEWLKKQPPDVAFRKVHVGLAPNWKPHQQMYYALEALGKAEALNDAIFFALHAQMMELDKRDRIADFVARNGVDRQKFIEAFESPAVRAKMAKADEMAKAFKLDSVPGLAVNGKWLTAPHMAGNREQALRVVDYLLAKERGGR